MRTLGIILLSLVVTLAMVSSTSAQSTTLQQSILPLSCSVNSINSGLSVNTFITPDDCPEELIPTSNTSSPNVRISAPFTSITNTNSPSTVSIDAKPQPTISDQIIEDKKLSLLIIATTLVLIWAFVRFYGFGADRKASAKLLSRK